MGEMQENTGAQLLRDYAEHRNQAVLRELVSRPADVIYAPPFPPAAEAKGTGAPLATATPEHL